MTNEKMITQIDRVEVMRFYQRKKDKSPRDVEELEIVTKLVDDYYVKNIPRAKAQ